MVCARALYVHANRLIIEAVYMQSLRMPWSCRCIKQGIEIKSLHGEILRKYKFIAQIFYT
jgi:hypothetical protein